MARAKGKMRMGAPKTRGELADMLGAILTLANWQAQLILAAIEGLRAGPLRDDPPAPRRRDRPAATPRKKRGK